MQGRPQLSRRRNASALTLFALKMRHHHADAIDADLRILGFTVPQPPVQTVNLRDDYRPRRRSFRIIRRKSAGDLFEVLQTHADMEPWPARQRSAVGEPPAAASLRPRSAPN